MSTVSKEAIKDGVQKAYEAEDYLLSDGKKDKVKVASRIANLLASDAKVITKGAVNSGAMKRGRLIATIFPKLERNGGTNRALTEAVYGVIRQGVWGMVSPNSNGAVQKIIPSTMGNGYVLCRTKVLIDDEEVDAVYVTDNRALIDEDFVRRENVALTNRIDQQKRNREMLINRASDDKDAKHFASAFDQTLKSAQKAVHEQMVAALQARAEQPEDESETEEVWGEAEGDE